MGVRIVLAAAAMVVATGVIGIGQDRPVFRAEANYVEVDAVVTDSAGRFVPGLTAGDFELREDRKVQRVDAFSYVELPDASTVALTPTRPILYRPDLPQQARPDADRIYLIYLSPVGSDYILPLRKQATDFVKYYMKDTDLGAVWDGESPGHEVTFTNDRGALVRSIAPFPMAGAGISPRGGTAAQIAGLKDAIDWLSSVQGRRKSLILFSAGLLDASTTRDARTAALRSTLMDVSTFDRSKLHDTPLYTISDLVQRADVHIYACDVRGLVAVGGTSQTTSTASAASAGDRVAAEYRTLNESIMNLRAVADATGGLALVNRNDYATGFARIVQDNSRYYLLGYTSVSRVPRGYFRSIDVRVKRPGLKVRARKGYIARE